MARLFGPELIMAGDQPVISQPVYVRHRGSLLLATLYADAAETAGANNPALTDSDGYLVFYVRDGYYDLIYQGHLFPIEVRSDEGGVDGGSVAGYRHVQTVPAATWIIAHNLGANPQVTVIDNDGEEVISDVVFSSVNTVTVIHGEPMTGAVELLTKEPS